MIFFSQLLRNPHVVFSGYKCPHPLIQKVVVRVLFFFFSIQVFIFFFFYYFLSLFFCLFITSSFFFFTKVQTEDVENVKPINVVIDALESLSEEVGSLIDQVNDRNREENNREADE